MKIAPKNEYTAYKFKSIHRHVCKGQKTITISPSESLSSFTSFAQTTLKY